MTYAETVAFLFDRLPMFQRIGPAAYRTGLDNTHALMDILGHPERGLRCVHVAGTNGKGSTCSLIASVLQEAGYNVGLHTSPHLKDFRERFRINGSMIPEEDVVRFVDQYMDAFEPLQASFFEWGVALAFWWFREQAVDIAVIETGMGGRLDSTNVVSPEVSVITNIGWDHMAFLGGTLEAIAAEKAGIIKPGVPVVVGEATGSVAEVIAIAAEAERAPVTFVDQGTELRQTIGLQGKHQQRNARTALAALERLKERGWHVQEGAIVKGFAQVVTNTGLRGRWEVIGHDPLTIVDAAHNVDGLRTVKRSLAATPHERLHIVLGTVKDKSLDLFLAELPHEAVYYFCKADIPRGLDAEELYSRCANYNLLGRSHGNVAEAVSAARLAAGSADVVLITGSIFVVAEAI